MSIDFIFIFLGCIAGTISGMLPGIGMTVIMITSYPLLIGYEKDPPDNFELSDGLYYNPYHDGNVIAMPQPLYDGVIEYIDGTNATLHQLSYDIVNFLSWVAEPELQKRKSLGLKVLIFLTVLTLLLYVTMKEIWSRIEK